MPKQKLITIYGIRRSGNHAIANWIMSHFDTGCYINDANRYIRNESNILPCHRLGQCKNTQLDKNPDIVIIGIENKLDKHIQDAYYKKLLSHNQPSNIEIINITLIRNCANLIASHLKAWNNEKYHEELPNSWKKHTDFFKQNNYSLIVYDSWLDSKYRNDIAKTLNFINHDFGVDQISSYGGGSSFGDKVVDIGNLINRWKSMLDNNRFLNIMSKF